VRECSTHTHTPRVMPLSAMRWPPTARIAFPAVEGRPAYADGSANIRLTAAWSGAADFVFESLSQCPRRLLLSTLEADLSG